MSVIPSTQTTQKNYNTNNHFQNQPTVSLFSNVDTQKEIPPLLVSVIHRTPNPSFYTKNIKPLIDIISTVLSYLIERIHYMFHTIFCGGFAIKEEEEEEIEINPPPPLPLPATPQQAEVSPAAPKFQPFRPRFKLPVPPGHQPKHILIPLNPHQKKLSPIPTTPQTAPPAAVIQQKEIAQEITPLDKQQKIIQRESIKQEIEKELLAPTNEWWRENYTADQLNKKCDDYIKQADNSTYILRKSTSDQSQKYTLHYKKEDINYNVRLEITSEGKLSILGQETLHASLADLKKALGLEIPVNLQTLKTFQKQTTVEQHLLNWKQEFNDVNELNFIAQFALLTSNGPHFFLRKSENQANVFYLSYKKDQQIIEEKLTLQANGTLQIPSQRNKVFQTFTELSQAIHLGTHLTLDELRQAKASLIKHVPKPAEFLEEPQAILDPQEEGEIEEAIGPRTLGMLSYLSGFTAYNPKTKQITIQGKAYTPVTGGTTQLSQKRLISCGSSTSREAVILDPENSPLLNAHFDKLFQKIQSKQQSSPLTEEQIIDEVIQYVRHDIFPSCTNRHLEQEVSRFIQDKWGSFPALYYKQIGGFKRQGYIPAIPIDEFIKANIGVCRHHGLVTGYLLDRLTRTPNQRPILQGVPQIIRDNIEHGAHVWTTFMSAQGEKWHIDTLWPVKKEFSQPQGIQHLQNEGYGVVAIQNQIKRTQWAQKLAVGGNEKKKVRKNQLDALLIKDIHVNHANLALLIHPGDYIISPSNNKPHTYVLQYADETDIYQKIFMLQQDGSLRFLNSNEVYQDVQDMVAQLHLKQRLTKEDIEKEFNINQR